jgi:hypothetical protein
MLIRDIIGSGYLCTAVCFPKAGLNYLTGFSDTGNFRKFVFDC